MEPKVPSGACGGKRKMRRTVVAWSCLTIAPSCLPCPIPKGTKGVYYLRNPLSGREAICTLGSSLHCVQ